MNKHRVTIHPALAARLAGPNGRWWRLGLAVLLAVFVGYLGYVFLMLPLVLQSPELGALFCPESYRLSNVRWEAIMPGPPSRRNRLWLACVDAAGSALPGRDTNDRASRTLFAIAVALSVWPLDRLLKRQSRHGT